MNAATERIFSVEGMTCAHCEVGEVAGVSSVRGEGVDDAAVRAAVGAAGYRITA